MTHLGHATQNWGALKVEQNSILMETSGKGVSRPILEIPLSEVSTASYARNNLLVEMLNPPHESDDVKLISVRFAVPSTCVGFEQAENAGKDLLNILENSLKDAHSTQLPNHGKTTCNSNELAEERIIVGVFDDIILSYPSGRFKLTLSTTDLNFYDKRKGSSFSVLSSNVECMYLCHIPNSFVPSIASQALPDEENQYVAIILKNPVKVAATDYPNLVLTFPAGLVLAEEYAWKCELTTQDQIDSALNPGRETENSISSLLRPIMSGKVSEIVLGALKAITKAPAFGGKNKNFATVLSGGQHSVLRCLYRASDGYLYVLSSCLLFLHRPATRILYQNIDRVVYDRSSSGSSTFQLVLYIKSSEKRGRSEKVVLSSLDQKEDQNLLKWFEEKNVSVENLGISPSMDEVSAELLETSSESDNGDSSSSESDDEFSDEELSDDEKPSKHELSKQGAKKRPRESSHTRKRKAH